MTKKRRDRKLITRDFHIIEVWFQLIVQEGKAPYNNMAMVSTHAHGRMF